MDNRVFIIQCDSYEDTREKLASLVQSMGGIEEFASPGERILLKVNLLRPAQPEEAVTTHPAVVAAIATMLKEYGAHPIIIDSPGSGYQFNQKALEKAYSTSGMQQVAEEAGIECNFDTEHQVISYPEGELIKRFEIINPVLEADGMFNLAKLKTHGFTLMTGAVKNIFGVIPGLAKPGYHAKLHDRDRFADMLLDLCTYVAPRLSFLDAVIGMEGDGPSAGAPRKLGLLLASANPLALDIVAGEIMGLEEKDNPLLVQARKQGMHPSTFEEVEVVGMEKENLRVADFTLPSVIQSGTGINAPAWIQNIMQALLKNGVTAKPVILRDTCTGCGVCMKACPMDTITLTSDNKATIEYDNCIRCYCCHEMCPEKAIELRHGLLYKLFARK